MREHYWLVLSRDPCEGGSAVRCGELARGLARAGHDVTLFLVQNGVLGARVGARVEALAGLREHGVVQLADEFSLRERGIPAARIAKDVEIVALDAVIDALSGGAKVLWTA